jgi:Fic family protein
MLYNWQQKKWPAFKATATRDLTEMVGLGVLIRLGEGAGVRYEIA